MNSALFIGRFQPFHNGHLAVVKEILNKHDRVIIAIGSAQYSREKHNPFTSHEREELIKAALKAENIPANKYIVVPVKDTHDDNWYYHLQAHLPPYTALYTGSEEVKSYFEAGNSSAKIIHLDRINNISGTKVRQFIKQGKPLNNFIPPAVAELLKKWETQNHDQPTHFPSL